MHRAFCKDLNTSSKTIKISDSTEIHHIKDVLRLRMDDKISTFNGKDVETLCSIASISSKEILLNIIESNNVTIKKPIIILACAMPKKSKFETIIEKSTELGVDKIIPLATKRTEVNIKEEKQDKKLLRFNNIALNAAKQSKRTLLPEITSILSFSAAIDSLDKNTIKIIPSLQKERKNLLNIFKDIKDAESIAFFIGPEGDFTDEEYLLAKEKGCIPATLGETILKVETAALCTISCANIFFRS